MTPGNRSTPLYQWVADDIVAKIESAFWQPGNKLPSERVLCEQYAVSQITVRRALRELAHLRRVYSHHGLGWFVSTSQPREAPTQEVTLLMPDLDWATSRLARSLVGKLDIAGVSLRLAFTDGHAANEAQVLQDVIARKTDAVMLIVAGEERNLAGHYKDLLQRVSVPTLLLWHDIQGANLAAATIDEGACMQVMTRHLLDLGHQRIAYVGGNPALVEGQRRYWGFATTLWEHGIDLPLSWVLTGELGDEGEVRKLQQICQGPDRPTALVCAADAYAARAMAILQRMEMRCPEDIAIVGLGDSDLAPLLPTPLTTFHFDLERLGEVAGTMILDLMAGHPVNNVHLSGQIVARQSCGFSYPRAIR